MIIFGGYIRILILLATLPALFLAYQVYKLDTIEKEPPKMLLHLALWGGIMIFPAMIIEIAFGWVIDFAFGGYVNIFYILVSNFIGVAMVEEACKYFILKRRTWASEEFNYRYDGIVYAVCVGAGFAVFENVLYGFSYGLGTILLRAITAIPAHIIFGIFMGHYYGEARRMENIGDPSGSFRYRAYSVIVPLLLHGFYDFAASVEEMIWVFWGFVVVLDLIAFRQIKLYAARDVSVDGDVAYDAAYDEEEKNGNDF